MVALQVLFWICVALLFHAYAGYPAWVWMRARIRPRPVRKQPQLPTVTVLMAVHEGAEHIRAKLLGILALDYPSHLLSVVVVCDGCSDASARIAGELDDTRIQVLQFRERRGKAAVLNEAVLAARGDVLLMTDVRQRLDPVALRELTANLADPDVGAVSGELRLEDANTGFARGIDAYWRYEKMIRNCESLSGSTVGVTGALYAIRRELYRPLPQGTVLDDVLTPMQVVRAGKRVVFEPRALAWDRPSQHPAEERRRKIRTLAGNFQLVQLAPWVISPTANPIWFRFVSHKLMRLLVPWLLLALFVLGIVLIAQHMIYAIALAVLLACAVLVMAGRVLPASASLLPVRLATALCYLNLFAAQALIAFVRNRKLHLW